MLKAIIELAGGVRLWYRQLQSGDGMGDVHKQHEESVDSRGQADGGPESTICPCSSCQYLALWSTLTTGSISIESSLSLPPRFLDHEEDASGGATRLGLKAAV